MHPEIKKKAFQSNVNCSLANIPGYITKFEHVLEGGACLVRSKVNKFEHAWESLYGGEGA